MSQQRHAHFKTAKAQIGLYFFSKLYQQVFGLISIADFIVGNLLDTWFRIEVSYIIT